MYKYKYIFPDASDVACSPVATISKCQSLLYNLEYCSKPRVTKTKKGYILNLYRYTSLLLYEYLCNIPLLKRKLL